jgi:hypothetical protein
MWNELVLPYSVGHKGKNESGSLNVLYFLKFWNPQTL